LFACEPRSSRVYLLYGLFRRTRQFFRSMSDASSGAFAQPLRAPLQQPLFDLFDLDPGLSQSGQANPMNPFEKLHSLNRAEKEKSSEFDNDGHICNSQSVKQPSFPIAALPNSKVSMKNEISSLSTCGRKKSKISCTILIPDPQDEQNISSILIDSLPWIVSLIWALLFFSGI
jgi:hypothetical protein